MMTLIKDKRRAVNTEIRARSGDEIDDDLHSSTSRGLLPRSGSVVFFFIDTMTAEDNEPNEMTLRMEVAPAAVGLRLHRQPDLPE